MTFSFKKQFDVIVMNPPYNGEVHIQFANIALELAKVCAIVQPLNWLFNDGDEAKLFKQKIRKISKYIKLINPNAWFNAGLYMPCTILWVDRSIKDNGLTVCDLNGKNHQYATLHNFNKFNNTTEYPSILAKLSKKNSATCWSEAEYTEESKKPRRKRNKQKTCFVNLARVRGHISKIKNNMFDDDFYTLIPKDLTHSNKREKCYHYPFATIKEADNFILFLKQKITRFCFAINKHGSSIRRKQLEGIPYFDFTQKWTDKQLKIYFGFTKKEINFIEHVIPNYYDEEKS